MSLLTEQEIYEMTDDGVFLGNVKEITRAIEAKVIEKIKAHGPVAYWDGCYSDPYFSADYDAPGIGKGGIPLYRLPEGD